MSVPLGLLATAAAVAAAGREIPPSFLYAPGFLPDGGDVLVGAPGEFWVGEAPLWRCAQRHARRRGLHNDPGRVHGRDDANGTAEWRYARLLSLHQQGRARRARRALSPVVMNGRMLPLEKYT